MKLSALFALATLFVTLVNCKPRRDASETKDTARMAVGRNGLSGIYIVEKDGDSVRLRYCYAEEEFVTKPVADLQRCKDDEGNVVANSRLLYKRYIEILASSRLYLDTSLGGLSGRITDYGRLAKARQNHPNDQMKIVYESFQVHGFNTPPFMDFDIDEAVGSVGTLNRGYLERYREWIIAVDDSISIANMNIETAGQVNALSIMLGELQVRMKQILEIDRYINDQQVIWNGALVDREEPHEDSDFLNINVINSFLPYVQLAHLRLDLTYRWREEIDGRVVEFFMSNWTVEYNDLSERCAREDKTPITETMLATMRLVPNVQGRVWIERSTPNSSDSVAWASGLSLRPLFREIPKSERLRILCYGE